MYNEKLAVAIKSAGKVLREFKDTVYVPFGAEYSIFIKNLNAVRALVKVSIDGQYVDESGDGIVIDANSSLDLERFIKNNNLREGNRFRFIERTGKVEQHRGIQVEDGLIRVEFQYEKRLPKIEVEEVHHYKHHYWHDDYWYDRWPYRPYIGRQYLCDSSQPYGAVSGEVRCSSLLSNSIGEHPGVPVNCVNSVSNTMGGTIGAATAVPTMDSMINEAGITVAGSKSEQQFHTVSSFPLEDTSHVIVLKLLGETAAGKKVKQAVTVKAKQKCTTCGHLNKANAKFCIECGTALEIV
jgi:hypothetical protein